MRNKKYLSIIALLSLLFIIVGCGGNPGVTEDPASIEGTAYVGYKFGDAAVAPIGRDVAVSRIEADGSLTALTTTAKTGVDGKFTLVDVPKNEKLLVTVTEPVANGEIIFQAPVVVTSDTATVEVTPSSTIFYDVLAGNNYGYLGNTQENWAENLNNDVFIDLFKDGLEIIYTNVETNTEAKAQVLELEPSIWFSPVVDENYVMNGELAYAALLYTYQTLVYDPVYDGRINTIREQLISESTLALTANELAVDGVADEWVKEFKLLDDPVGDINESTTVSTLGTYTVGYDLVASYGASDSEYYYFGIKLGKDTLEISTDTSSGGKMVVDLQFGNSNQMYPRILVVTAENIMNGSEGSAIYKDFTTYQTTEHTDKVFVEFDETNQFVEFAIHRSVMELVDTEKVYMFVNSYVEQTTVTDTEESIKTIVDTMYYKQVNLK